LFQLILDNSLAELRCHQFGKFFLIQQPLYCQKIDFITDFTLSTAGNPLILLIIKNQLKSGIDFAIT